jgi:hypothetical protein
MINAYDVIVQVISFMLGSLISFLMSWYFYKKADFPSRVTSAMAEDVLLLLIQGKIGVDFNFHGDIPKDESPKVLTTPHILQYWLSNKIIKPGEALHLLFRVEDTDFDFPGAENIETTEMESNVSFPSRRQGHGYYLCEINCPKNATPGFHTVSLKLKDVKGNKHTHNIKFEVVSEANLLPSSKPDK